MHEIPNVLHHAIFNSANQGTKNLFCPQVLPFHQTIEIVGLIRVSLEPTLYVLIFKVPIFQQIDVPK